MNWQTMESAPKDRYILLVESGDTIPFRGIWMEVRDAYEYGGKMRPARNGEWKTDGEGFTVEPVMWHELPVSPFAPEPAGGGR